MGTATVDDSTVAGLHGRTAVAFIRADSTGATVGPGNPVRARLSLQFTKDNIFVRKKILDQTVAVTLIHCKAAFDAWTENALRQRLGELNAICLISGGKVNQACKMGHYGVQRSDVVKTKLSKRALQNLDPTFFCSFVGSSRIDRLYNLINLGRNKGVWGKS